LNIRPEQESKLNIFCLVVGLTYGEAREI